MDSGHDIWNLDGDFWEVKAGALSHVTGRVDMISSMEYGYQECKLELSGLGCPQVEFLLEIPENGRATLLLNSCSWLNHTHADSWG